MGHFKVIEAFRGLAATYVFAGHVVLAYFDRSMKWTSAFYFGQEAVMLFFLISGFVILYSMEVARDKSFRAYLGRRFFRIYPIFLLALFSGFCLSGSWKMDFDDLLGNIFMLQDLSLVKPGVLFDTFAGNSPLWSLSYEWWFYLMFFPFYRFVAERLQLAVITVIGVAEIIVYNATHFQPMLFLAYFPIWWSGAEIGRAVSRNDAIPFVRVITGLAVITAVFGIYFVLDFVDTRQFSFGIHPFLELRHAGTCLAMVLLLFGYRYISFLRLHLLLMPFAKIAPISYGIYALHYPLVVNDLVLGLPLPIRIPAVMVLVFAIAWFAEIPYQGLAQRLRRAWGTSQRTKIA